MITIVIRLIYISDYDEPLPRGRHLSTIETEGRHTKEVVFKPIDLLLICIMAGAQPNINLGLTTRRGVTVYCEITSVNRW